MTSFIKRSICTIATFLILGFTFYRNSLVVNRIPSSSSNEAAANTEAALDDKNMASSQISETIQKDADPEEGNSDDSDEAGMITPNKKEGNIILAFTGDILFSDYSLQLYEKSGISSFIEDSLLQELSDADYYMLNEEFPFSNRGIAASDKQYTFCVDPRYVSIFQELGADIVTLANNHTLDYGNEALLDTISTLDSSGIMHVGAGKNLEDAKKPVIASIENKSVGFLGASRVLPLSSWSAGRDNTGIFSTYDSAILESEISDLKSNCDFVIVYVHWGIERNEYPEDYQRELAEKYIDAGADMVIGSHPHVLQGFAFYKGKPIIYSLGNFLFSNSAADTIVLKVMIDENNESRISLIPCQRVNGQMRHMRNSSELIRHLNELSYGAFIDDNGLLHEDSQ